MNVKMLISQSGPDVNRTPGEVVQVDAGEGARLIAAGIAAAVFEETETATAPAVETATANRKKKR
jgi:hypothetical protein